MSTRGKKKKKKGNRCRDVATIFHNARGERRRSLHIFLRVPGGEEKGQRSTQHGVIPVDYSRTLREGGEKEKSKKSFLARVHVPYADGGGKKKRSANGNAFTSKPPAPSCPIKEGKKETMAFHCSPRKGGRKK